jgi:hypothetical protein
MSGDDDRGKLPAPGDSDFFPFAGAFYEFGQFLFGLKEPDFTQSASFNNLDCYSR